MSARALRILAARTGTIHELRLGRLVIEHAEDKGWTPETWLLAIAARGGRGDDWAAYAAPGNWPAVAVYERGCKLSPDEAAHVFPVIAAGGLEYRR